MPASMRDVAALANVSQRTVSNVVNDYIHVKPETRTKVQRAIEMLGYRPNVTARKLRGGKSGLIALAIPEIAAPYFAELADLIQKAAAAQDQVLLIEQTGGTRARELSVLHGYPAAMIDGLVLNPIAITAADLEPRQDNVPTLFLGERIDLEDGVASGHYIHVSIDNVAAARVATEHLIGLGRTRIAALGATTVGPSNTGPHLRRTHGYLDALRSHGLTAHQELVIPLPQWTAGEGYLAVKKLIADRVPFDSLFCFNDTIAIGAISALHEAGRTIPDDVAVVGWDNTHEAQFSVPPLTTIAPDTAQIATTSVDRLLALIRGETDGMEDVLVPFRLITRRSTVAFDD